MTNPNIEEQFEEQLTKQRGEDSSPWFTMGRLGGVLMGFSLKKHLQAHKGHPIHTPPYPPHCTTWGGIPYLRVAPLVVFSFLFPISISYAADLSGFPFLKLPAGARELGMGSASAAVTDDVNGIYWNPAGLSSVRTFELGLTHAETVLDTRYDFVGLAQPLSKAAIGFGALYLNTGSQEGRNEYRERTGNFSSSDLAFSFSFAYWTSSRLSLGTTLKLFESRIAGDQARGAAFDYGAQMDLGRARTTRIALNIRNVGHSVRFVDKKEPLPFGLSAGIAQRVYRILCLSSEFEYEPRTENKRVGFGTETSLGALALRAGYSSTDARDINFSRTAVNGITGGLGIRISDYRFDYSFSPNSSSGESHRLSLLVRFDRPSSKNVFVRQGGAEPASLDPSASFEKISFTDRAR